MLNHEGILKRLEQAGYTAYLVGGCVRDELLGLEVNDFDIATNATPEQIEVLFQGEAIDFIGKTFGVMIVNGIEVATFRSEVYQTLSKPDVALVGSFREDASRRDFTINAMARTREGQIIDFFGGQRDLSQKVLRAVGDPSIRFQEDPSRILRAIYLASYLGFDIAQETQEKMRAHEDLLYKVPLELMGKIVTKVIKRNSLSSFMEWLETLDMMRFVFPSLVHTVGIPQNPKYHNSDVFEHILRVIRAVEQRHPGDVVMNLSALFHDVAKGMPEIRGVNKEGQPNDLQHEEAGMPIAKRAMQELRFSCHIIDQVLFNVRFHGIQLPEKPKRGSVIKRIQYMVPYFRTKEELTHGINRLFQFMDCDTEGFNPSFGEEKRRVNHLVRQDFQEVLDSTVFYRAELPINGQQVMQQGYKGKEIGEVLDALVKENIQGPEAIQDFLTKYKQKKKPTNN